MLDQKISQQFPGSDSLLTWGELAHIIRDVDGGISSGAHLPILLPMEKTQDGWKVVSDDLNHGFAKACELAFGYSATVSPNSVKIPAQDGRRFITQYDVPVRHVPLLSELEASRFNGYYTIPISRSEARGWLESQEVS
jgi:hypothetical protein